MTTLGHRVVPSLLARSLRETVEFYVGKLGFRITGRYPSGGPLQWAELSRDGVSLQFFAEPPRGIPGTPVMSGTIYLYPGSVEAIASELAGRVPFAWGPEVMDYGMRELGIRDPNGYLLAFTEPA